MKAAVPGVNISKYGWILPPLWQSHFLHEQQYLGEGGSFADTPCGIEGIRVGDTPSSQGAVAGHSNKGFSRGPQRSGTSVEGSSEWQPCRYTENFILLS